MGMLKENDLRVGNFVRSIKHKTVYEIEHLTNYGDLYLKNPHFEYTDDDGDYPMHDYEPIPLIPEELLKLGAEKINNSMFRMGPLTFQPTTYTDGETLTERLLNTRKAMRICFCGKFLVNIEFVHQYQNLYHSLTGKELTIRKTKSPKINPGFSQN